MKKVLVPIYVELWSAVSINQEYFEDLMIGAKLQQTVYENTNDGLNCFSSYILKTGNRLVISKLYDGSTCYSYQVRKNK